MTDITYTHDARSAASPEEPGPYPESTLSLRLDVDGIGVSWTLRGTDESMAKRLPRVLDYLRRLQAKLPTPKTPPPAAVPQAPLEEREDWCPLHQVAMVRQENSRGSWLSHRTAEGTWCKGKPQRAGERAS